MKHFATNHPVRFHGPDPAFACRGAVRRTRAGNLRHTHPQQQPPRMGAAGRAC